MATRRGARREAPARQDERRGELAADAGGADRAEELPQLWRLGAELGGRTGAGQSRPGFHGRRPAGGRVYGRRPQGDARPANRTGQDYAANGNDRELLDPVFDGRLFPWEVDAAEFWLSGTHLACERRGRVV